MRREITMPRSLPAIASDTLSRRIFKNGNSEVMAQR